MTGLVVPLAGCGGSGETAGTDGSDPAVLATTTVWGDITSHVACDEPVTAIIPAGADPHSFEPSLRDRQAIEHADLVVANGHDLEHSLVDLLQTAIGEGANVIEITSHVDVLSDEHAEDESTDEGHAADDGHGHGIAGDPHIWQDPTRVAGALDVIGSALAATGRDEPAIDACAVAYHDQLMALDAEITEILSVVPADRRLLVTSHDSLAYFANRYDFEIVGTVIPASNTLAETSAAELAALADVIEQRGVPAIFTEQLESTADADALAQRLGVRIVPLVTDSLVDDPTGDSYVEMLRGNAEKIAEALTP